MGATFREDIFKEIDILVGMNHENVIFLKEYFEEGNKVYLITELLTGQQSSIMCNCSSLDLAAICACITKAYKYKCACARILDPWTHHHRRADTSACTLT